jgi:hypothetical protein
LGIAGPVDVAKSAIAHLLEQFPSFEARVARKLASTGVLLGNELGEIRLVDTLALGLGRDMLSSLGVVSSGVTGLSGSIVAIARGLRVGAYISSILGESRMAEGRLGSRHLFLLDWLRCLRGRDVILPRRGLLIKVCDSRLLA